MSTAYNDIGPNIMMKAPNIMTIGPNKTVKTSNIMIKAPSIMTRRLQEHRI